MYLVRVKNATWASAEYITTTHTEYILHVYKEKKKKRKRKRKDKGGDQKPVIKFVWPYVNYQLIPTLSNA